MRIYHAEFGGIVVQKFLFFRLQVVLVNSLGLQAHVRKLTLKEHILHTYLRIRPSVHFTLENDYCMQAGNNLTPQSRT